MKKNMGSTDRVIRIIVAVVIAGLFFTHQISGVVATVLLVITGILILTSFRGFCPLYAIFRPFSSKKGAKLILILFILSPSALLAQQSQPFKRSINDSSTVYLPIFKHGFRPQFVVSVAGGVQNNAHFDHSAPVIGVDIALMCGLLCTKRNYIRNSLSIIYRDGKQLKSWSAELNPQYKIVAEPRFEFGIGPSFGVIFAKLDGVKKYPFTYGLGSSITYNISNIFFALESRYDLTGKVDFNSRSNINSNSALLNRLDNWRTLLKIGYRF